MADVDRRTETEKELQPLTLVSVRFPSFRQTCPIAEKTNKNVHNTSSSSEESYFRRLKNNTKMRRTHAIETVVIIARSTRGM